MKNFCIGLGLSVLAGVAMGQPGKKMMAGIDAQINAVEPQMIAWRREFHEHPELSNREFKTAEKVADHLRKLGLRVQTGVAHTGVVGLLETGRRGPVIALRADMDALPVTERNDLPFASKVTAMYNGQETGVMHACGHDTHIAILMAVAEILSKNKSDLRGTVKFIFQPAEEGAPKGEAGGADLMVREGVLENPAVDVIFGLHIWSIARLGTIAYRPGPFMAAADFFTIKVYGTQAHGSTPWRGVDPIVVSAQIIDALQTIISRQTDLTKNAAVITVGKIHSGVRENIIPEYAEMGGTIRTFDPGTQKDIHERMTRTVRLIAESAGAKAEIDFSDLAPVTYNNPALTEQMLPSLTQAAGAENVMLVDAVTGAEDFSFYQQKVPGLFFFVGACPPDRDPATAPSHHTPDFMIDEKGMLTGLRAIVNLTLDYMYMK